MEMMIFYNSFKNCYNVT